MTESHQLRENAPRFFGLLARGLPVALDQVRKLERLVDDLLDTTRLTQVKLRLQSVILDLSETLSRYLKIRSSDLQAQKISLSWCIDPQIGILGDRARRPRNRAFLCRQIVEGHGGTIRYQNPPDGERGALFEVNLPKASLPSPDVKLSEK